MIITKKPLPGNLYLIKHDGGICDTLVYVHEDGSESTAWPYGETLHRFGAFARPGSVGTGVWLNSVSDCPSWHLVLVGRPGKLPHQITDGDILDIYDRFGVAHELLSR